MNMMKSLAKLAALLLPWAFRRSDGVRRRRISKEVREKDEDATNARWDGWEKKLRLVPALLAIILLSGCGAPSGEPATDPSERIRYITYEGVDGVFVPLARWERITLLVDELYEED